MPPSTNTRKDLHAITISLTSHALGEHCWCCQQPHSQTHGRLIEVALDIGTSSARPIYDLGVKVANIFVCNACQGAKCPYRFLERCRVGC